jgi:hypothetical protein
MRSSCARSFSRVVARRASLTASQSSQTRLYHDNIVEHYENPRNVGSLDKTDSSVGTVSVARLASRLRALFSRKGAFPRLGMWRGRVCSLPGFQKCSHPIENGWGKRSFDLVGDFRFADVSFIRRNSPHEFSRLCSSFTVRDLLVPQLVEMS